MSNGFRGKIIRINLSSGAINIEQPEADFYRTYFGAEALLHIIY
jgi:aldehyde:ferredoxin oxidoreductase